MRAGLLSILLTMAFLVGAPAANGEERRPVNDVYEAIRVAETMLSEEEEYATKYANGKLKISMVKKHYDALNYLTVDDTSSYDRALRDKLEGRSYWYVGLYSNINLPVAGGTISFFIDAETSELIHTYKSR